MTRTESGADDPGADGPAWPSVVVRHTDYDAVPSWEYALLRWYETLAEAAVEARRLMMVRRPGSRYFARSVPPAASDSVLDDHQLIVVVVRWRRRRDEELPDERIDLLGWHHDEAAADAEVRRLETDAGRGAQHFTLLAVSAAAKRSAHSERLRQESAETDGTS